MTRKSPFNRCLLTLFLALCAAGSLSLSHAATWYVKPNGQDNRTNGRGTQESKPFKTLQYAFNQLSAGDTLFVLPGTYYNPGYGNGSLNNGPALSINKSGTPGNWIRIKKKPGAARPNIRFDGSGGIIAGGNINYIEISGLNITGKRASITKSEAESHRLDNPKKNYYVGRGIAFWGPSHHITIAWVTAQDCPGSGIRVNKGDYITLRGNTVRRCSWISSSGESGLVIAEALKIDEGTGNKMKVERNKAVHNINWVPIYFPGSTAGSGYGGVNYTKIADGRGIYMTRNDNYNKGKYYIVNNWAWYNGHGGITFHRSDNGIINSNTIWGNGLTFNDGSRTLRQGLHISDGTNVWARNNLISARGGGAVYEYLNSSNVTLSHNLIHNGTSAFTSSNSVWNQNPQLVNVSTGSVYSYNLRIKSNSPAKNAGTGSQAPSKDIFNKPRPGNGNNDIGAHEIQ